MSTVFCAWATRVWRNVAAAARASCATRVATAVAALAVFAALLCGAQLASAQFVQQGPKLVGTGVAEGAAQGISVAVSADGNTAVVGGPGNNGGATWVFTRSNGVWAQQGQMLVGTGGVAPTFQGTSVALSADGNTAIVGGPGDDEAVGAAWIFIRTNDVWTQQGQKLVGTGSVGNFLGGAGQGLSVALSADGNTAIVGGARDNNGVGAVWVFTRSNGMWTQQGQKLVGTGGTSASQGYSVALSADGNTVIVGGPSDSNELGAAWVFTRNNEVWTQQGQKLYGTGSTGILPAQQGRSVALSADGNTAIVGGPLDFDGVGAVGAAWVFTRSNGAWTQQGQKLVGTGEAGFDQQGTSVALSGDGNTAVVGGPQDVVAGAVWVFTRSDGTWQQGQKLVGTGSAGTAVLQGSSVALSTDGKTIISGGYGDDYNGATWVFVQSPSLQVTPATDIAASGYRGGPFNPSSFQYQLSASVGSLNYTISGIPSWLNANITSGTATTTPTTVTFSLNNVGSLALGTYTGTIAFTNTDTGNGNTTRSATLAVIGLPTLSVTPPVGFVTLTAMTFTAYLQQGDTNTYTIDFGDGTNSGPLALRPAGMGCVASGPCYAGVLSTSHTYLNRGNYTATLRNGAGTGAATAMVTVANIRAFAPPVSRTDASAGNRWRRNVWSGTAGP
jgi:hypothetical protein